MIDNSKGSFLRIHRSILLVLLLVTSIAVSLYFGSFKPKATRSTTISYPIELSCALEKASIGLKENLTVEFTLRNVSNQTITLKKPYMWPTTSKYYSRYYSTAYGGANITQPPKNVSSLFHFGVAFACSNGTVIFEAAHGILTGSYLISLEPNGYIEQTMLLDIGLDNLQAGNYEVRAIFAYYVPDVHGLNALETPSITVTVG